MSEFICSVITAIIIFTFTTILWLSSIKENYGLIINKATNNLYIEYQNNLYKLIPIKE